MPSSQHSLHEAKVKHAAGQCIVIHKVLWDQGESFTCSCVSGKEWHIARAWITQFLQQKTQKKQREYLLRLKCAL